MSDLVSFREKSAWIALLTTSVTWGAYLLWVGTLPHGQPGGRADAIVPFCATVALLIVLQVALHAAAAALAPRDAAAPCDERERLIELRALRVGFYVAQIGAFGALAASLLRVDVSVIANVILAAMVAAEIARAGAAIVDFRRTAG